MGRLPLKLIVNFRFLQYAECFNAGGRGEWIPGKRPGLVHWPQRCHHLHNIFSAAIGPYGEAATYNLSQTGQIRRYIIKALGAAVSHSKAGYDFIEDEQCSGLASQATEMFQKPGPRQYNTHITSYRLN